MKVYQLTFSTFHVNSCILTSGFFCFCKAGSLLLPTVAPAASTLSKQEQDRLAMPPPPTPQVSVSPSAEGIGDTVDADKPSLAAPLAGTIGSGDYI